MYIIVAPFSNSQAGLSYAHIMHYFYDFANLNQQPLLPTVCIYFSQTVDCWIWNCGSIQQKNLMLLVV